MELQFKKAEIIYSIRSHKFIKKSLSRKIPHELILEIVKYVGFNEICFNPYNMLYNYSKYIMHDLSIVTILSKHNFNREWETTPT